MKKDAFLDLLRRGLDGLPQEELAERLSFYREMIEDRMEEGLSEEAAVAEIGPADQLVAQIRAEFPPAPQPQKAEAPRRRLQPWEILLLVLGFPLWFPLLAAAFAVLLSLLAVLWSLVLSLWTAELSLAAGALGGLAAGALFLFRGDTFPGLAMLGAGLMLAGLSIFLFYGCRAAAAGSARVTEKMIKGSVSLFRRKEKQA